MPENSNVAKGLHVWKPESQIAGCQSNAEHSCRMTSCSGSKGHQPILREITNGNRRAELKAGDWCEIRALWEHSTTGLGNERDAKQGEKEKEKKRREIEGQLGRKLGDRKGMGRKWEEKLIYL